MSAARLSSPTRALPSLRAHHHLPDYGGAWRIRYPNEVLIPVGEGGQTRPGVILCHQVRTISLLRAQAMLRRSGGRLRYVIDPGIRAQVREALRRHFGLDIPAVVDGAAT